MCRGHFRSFFNDETIQEELAAVATKQGAILFTWKIHNIVTAWGIHRGQWQRAKLFPKAAGFNVSQFLLPSAHAATRQLRVDRACAHTTATCMSRTDGFAIISEVQGRWMIEGGIDQPLTDSMPAACAAPAPDQPVLKLDMYVMGKCPWCAKALEDLADQIACDFSCQDQSGQTQAGRLEFNIHMVGLNGGSYAAPVLQSPHGPSELVCAARTCMCIRAPAHAHTHTHARTHAH